MSWPNQEAGHSCCCPAGKDKHDCLSCMFQFQGGLKLTPTSRWRIFFLSYLSDPASDRAIYRTIVQKRPYRILELGMADGRRALRMIDAAARFTSRSDIQYIGLDHFEDRGEGDGPGLSLKTAHRELTQSGAKIKLIPGDPLRNLARAANELGQIDLLVISRQAETDRLSRVWYFVPRLLHAQSRIFVEQLLPGGKKGLAGRIIPRSRAMGSQGHPLESGIKLVIIGIACREDYHPAYQLCDLFSARPVVAAFHPAAYTT